MYVVSCYGCCVQEIDLLKTKLGEAEGRLKYYENQAASSLSPERDLLATPLISLDSPAPPPSNTSYSLPTSPSPTPTDPNKVPLQFYYFSA